MNVYSPLFFFLFMYSYSSYWNVASVLRENQIPFYFIENPSTMLQFHNNKKNKTLLLKQYSCFKCVSQWPHAKILEGLS